MLLLFFAIPLATIILSAIFETLIHSPFKIAGIAFSIFLITAFAFGGTTEFLIATIIYTILAFVTAFIVKIISNKIFDNNRRRPINRRGDRDDRCGDTFSEVDNDISTYNNEDMLRNRFDLDRDTPMYRSMNRKRDRDRFIDIDDNFKEENNRKRYRNRYIE